MKNISFNKFTLQKRKFSTQMQYFIILIFLEDNCMSLSSQRTKDTNVWVQADEWATSIADCVFNAVTVLVMLTHHIWN